MRSFNAAALAGSLGIPKSSWVGKLSVFFLPANTFLENALSAGLNSSYRIANLFLVARLLIAVAKAANQKPCCYAARGSCEPRRQFRACQPRVLVLITAKILTESLVEGCQGVHEYFRTSAFASRHPCSKTLGIYQIDRIVMDVHV